MVAVAVAIIMALLFVVGLAAGSQTGTLSGVALSTLQMDPGLEAALRAGGDRLVATGTITLRPGGGADVGAVEAPQAFSAVDDIALHLPFAQTQDVIFLEADSAEALPMVPVGTMTRNANPEGYQAAEDFAGPAYSVAPPVSGVRPATGMAALLAAPGAPVLAPVQGVVSTVSEYTTEAGTADWKVTLQPVGRPDLQVVLRHIDVPLVIPGQEVTVGLTQIGTVRAGAVVDAEMNPLSLPAALLHVRPATQEERVLTPADAGVTSTD